MNLILEKLSWIPRNLLLKKSFKKGNNITLNFEKIGIPEKVKFTTSKFDEGLSLELKAFGFREPINSRFYYNFISDKDIVLDIGANLGFFSILSLNAKKIIAIEPLKECIPLLKKNIKQNELEQKTIILNSAVGVKESIFLEVSKKLNHSKVSDKKIENTIEIKSKPIAYFVQKYNVNTIRMDIEGYEYDLLYKKDLSGIQKISLEYHTGIIGNKKTKNFLEFMEKENFVVKDLIDELPLRLYPFYGILKMTGLLNRFITVKKNIQPVKSFPYFLKGRSVKHINFERINYEA